MGARSSLDGQRVKPTRIFIDGEEKEFLFQQDIGPFLRACNSQAVGYAIRVGMTWLGGAARVWRILQPCFLAVETTDLRRAKI